MRYRVVAGYVTVEMGVPEVPGARARRDVPRGELLPEDVPAAEVQALLSSGDIEPAGQEPTPQGPTRYAFAEPATGGEAFIPKRGDMAKRPRAKR